VIIEILLRSVIIEILHHLEYFLDIVV